MTALRPLLTVLAIGFLSGCVIRDLPPEDENGAPVTPVAAAPVVEPVPAPPPPFETPAGTVTVKAGQTLYGIARAAEVPALALIDANHLQPPYRLAVGRVLTIPPLRQHVVQTGETLYGVAQEYGVEASALAERNHLTPPYNVKTGTVLMLPAAAVAATAPPPGTIPGRPPATVPGRPPAEAAAPAAVALPAPATAPVPLRSTAPPATGGISVVPLPPPPTANPVSANPSRPPGAAIAQTSPPGAAIAQTSPPSAAVTPTPPPAPPQIATTAPTPLAPKVKQAPPPPAPTSAAKPDETAAPSAEIAQLVASHKPPEAPLFLRPVHGRILSLFGDTKAGGHNDGINIAAPEGTTVSAAENGTVAYAGNELKGFGNLLLIKHPDGWVTAYAHNQVLLVKKGQKVRRGEPIARVGSSGGVTPAQLHFELRRGTMAVDPLDHLPPEASSAG